MASPSEGKTMGSSSRDQSTYSGIIRQKVSSLVKKAERARENGDLRHSLSLLSRAIALDPSDHALFRLRAAVHSALGDHTAAIANYNKTLSLCPSESMDVACRLADAHSRRGVELVARGDHTSALRDFTFASDLCHSDRDYVMRRMDCLLSLGRSEECLKMIEAELKRAPPTPQLHLMHAKLNIFFEKRREVYESLLQVLELDPAHQEAIELKQRQEAEARQLQDQAVKFLLLGQRDGALNKISAAIECDPCPAEFHILRGAIHRQNGEFVKAVDELLTAVDKCGGKREREKTGSTYSTACRQLVCTYNDFAIQCFKRGKFEEAIKLLDKALEEEKEEAGLYVNRGDCFHRLDNLYFALADYCRAQQLSLTDWHIRCRVAVTQCELGVKEFSGGNHTEAETLFSRAISNNPKISRFYFYRAKTRHELKSTSGVKEDLFRLLILEPECDAAFPLLARVFPGKTRAELLGSPTLAMTSAELSADIERCEREVAVKHEPSKEQSLAQRRERELQELFVGLKLVDGEEERERLALTQTEAISLNKDTLKCS